MPKLVYLQGLKGPAPQLWQDDSVLGVTGEKTYPVLQEHKITEKEAELSLDELMKIYPYTGG